MDEIPTVDTLPHTPGSISSEITADSMVSKARNQRREVWLFVASKGRAGATFDEVKQAFDWRSDKPRMIELQRLGRVRKTSEMRATRSRRPAAVWVAIERAYWPEPKTGWPCPRPPKVTARGKLVAENKRLWAALEIFSDANRNGLQPCPFCYTYGEHSGRLYRAWKEEYGKGRCIVEDINARKREGV